MHDGADHRGHAWRNGSHQPTRRASLGYARRRSRSGAGLARARLVGCASPRHTSRIRSERSRSSSRSAEPPRNRRSDGGAAMNLKGLHYDARRKRAVLDGYTRDADGERRRRQRTIENITKREAVEEWKKFRADLESGRAIDGPMTLKQFVDLFFEDIGQTTRRARARHSERFSIARSCRTSARRCSRRFRASASPSSSPT